MTNTQPCHINYIHNKKFPKYQFYSLKLHSTRAIIGTLVLIIFIELELPVSWICHIWHMPPYGVVGVLDFAWLDFVKNRLNQLIKRILHILTSQRWRLKHQTVILLSKLTRRHKFNLPLSINWQIPLVPQNHIGGFGTAILPGLIKPLFEVVEGFLAGVKYCG